MERNQISIVKEFRKEKIEVLYRKAPPINDPRAKYPGFNPGKTILRKGTVKEKGRLPLPCDIIWERDVAVTLRDGTVIYTDIFRPTTDEKYPAIIAWSPYGKMNSGVTTIAREVPFNAGIPFGATSGFESFEAPDPAYWCNHGYVILTPDVRGVMMSNGNYEWWGQQGAEDGYDFIEWAAAQSWCNGKTALAGNSQLTIMQWVIAALNPPHLAAIAPWEGLNDMYRNDIYDGGIKDYGFNKAILYGTTGNNYLEDIPAMADKYPLLNAYWESKNAKVEDIKVPAYVVASYTNMVHARGTLQAWAKLNMNEKWLRIHNTFEWPDFYDPKNVEDLRQFFDRYLKDIDNGWEKTPRVTISVLDPGGTDTVGRIVDDFPLPQTKYQKLFLDAESGSLTPNAVRHHSTVRYRADPGTYGKTSFTMRFKKDVELIGFFKLRLWVEVEGHNDMDIFVWCQKLDKYGRPLCHFGIPFPKPVVSILKARFKYGLLGKESSKSMFYSGPFGKQKASLRKLDDEKSTPYLPIHAFDEFQYLKPGEIVPVEISLWPCGMRYRVGEQFRVIVASYNIKGQHLPYHDKVKLNNKGYHIIHTGGKYDSHLLVPVIPSPDIP